jgi:hypothetical protein
MTKTNLIAEQVKNGKIDKKIIEKVAQLSNLELALLVFNL